MNVLTKKTLTGVFAAFVFALMAVFTPLTPSVSAACPAGATGLQAGLDCANPGEGNVPQNLFQGDGNVFTTIVNVLLFLIGAISVIMLIYGGIRYTISGGNSANVTAAKNTILYAIIGLIVAFLAYAIVNWVLQAVGNNV
jgi:ABC-type Co2+ transport system permease subunit